MIPEEETRKGDVTVLLLGAREGDPGALDRLWPLVYDQLRELARRQLRRERAGHTLYATALVHEAYLKLVDETRVEWRDRAHFLGVAARAMRQVLIDYARRRNAEKRGGGWEQTSLTGIEAPDERRFEELIALEDALERLDERQRRVVECRFFAGMTEQEIAEALGLSERTVRREWVKARAWLYRALYGGEAGEGEGTS